MSKKFFAAIIIIAILFAGFIALASNPMIICDIDIPESYMEAIESQSKGLYSKTLPLAAVYVSVEDFSSGKVYYTIHYFPFGTVGMSYTEGDGYNMEKPLINQ